MRVLVLGVLVISALLAPAGVSAQQTECDGNFQVVHDVSDGALNAVDFAATGTGWAVGFDYENDPSRARALGDGPTERPWIVRFDDNTFEEIHPPHQPGTELNGVSALTDTDVWAVGEFLPNYRRSKAIAYHWGGADWTQMTVSRRGQFAQLNDVVALSPTDVWAVGFYSPPGEDSGERPLVLHYNGAIWKHVPVPSPGEGAILDAVDGITSNNVWAVGAFTKRLGSSWQPLAVRWNGSEWKRRRLGLEFRKHERFLGVDAVSTDDVWIVGDGTKRSLGLHYDGDRWAFSDFPATLGQERLEDVAASATTAWVVGQGFIAQPYETSVPLAAHLVEGTWERSSFEGQPYGHISSVALDEAGNAWATGETFDPETDGGSGEVIEKACAP